jgi:hypothetical protein
MTKIVEQSKTSWEINDAGSIVAWGRGVTVYVDQPGRSCVVDSERFSALSRDLNGNVERTSKTADEPFALAQQLLAEFDADPGTPTRLREAREVRVGELRAENARLHKWLLDEGLKLHKKQGILHEARRHLDEIAQDMTVPLPFIDAVPHKWHEIEHGR